MPTYEQFIEKLLTFRLVYVLPPLLLLALIHFAIWYASLVPTWLDPEEFKPLKLKKKEWLNHNTVLLRFQLPKPDQRLGLPIGQHISFLAKDADGKDVYRSYTPISSDKMLGRVDFVIKTYPQVVRTSMRDRMGTRLENPLTQGKMSQAIVKLKEGESMLMKGPKGRLTYQLNMKKHIGMLAGGSGITPMYQIACAILDDPKDRTEVSLIFGNLTEADILLRKELEALAAAHPNQFKVQLSSPIQHLAETFLCSE